jgi:hypothetical protein
MGTTELGIYPYPVMSLMTEFIISYKVGKINYVNLLAKIVD